jgi:NHS family xanthosine MFS transporter
VISRFFEDANGSKDWQGIWLAFAAYSLAVAIAFLFLFEEPEEAQS